METAVMLDIDSTLTPPRLPITKEMVNVLEQLNVPFHVVAGSHFSLLEGQFFNPLYDYGFNKQFDAFVSNGAIHYSCDYSQGKMIKLISEFKIRDELGEKDYNFLIETLKDTLTIKDFQLPPTLNVMENRIADRVSMINFCPIGRLAKEDVDAQINRKKFVEFDEQHGYRQKVMDYLNQKLDNLIRNKNLWITLGGQTSFDIGIRDEDKTKSIRELLDSGLEGLVFIGDALHEDGNDYAVRHLIENWTKYMERWPKLKSQWASESNCSIVSILTNSLKNGFNVFSVPSCPVVAIQTCSWKNTIEILKKLDFIS